MTLNRGEDAWRQADSDWTMDFWCPCCVHVHSSPEKSFSYGELRRVVEICGLRVRHRTGILAFPGILRMAELLL